MNISVKKEFKIAFSVEDYFAPSKLKNDSTYVKWLIRLLTKKDGKWLEEELSTHMCTEEDYAGFFPIQDHQFSLLEEIKKDPNRGFLCLDEDPVHQIELYGREVYDDYQRLEVFVLPCNSISTELGLINGKTGLVSEECNRDIEK